jgi:predicted MFS family arabinose efflux permease
LVVCGVAEAIIMVADRSIQQRRTPDAVRSRVSSASESMVDIALSFGFVVGGPAVAALGPRVVYALGGAFGLVGAAVLIPVLRASRRASRAEIERVADEVELDEVGSDELVAARVGG